MATIKVIHYLAFGMKHKQAFVDETDKHIEDKLRNLCQTNQILLIEVYEGNLISTEKIKDEHPSTSHIAPESSKPNN